MMRGNQTRGVAQLVSSILNMMRRFGMMQGCLGVPVSHWVFVAFMRMVGDLSKILQQMMTHCRRHRRHRHQQLAMLHCLILLRSV
jgi:hypothetical protein